MALYVSGTILDMKIGERGWTVPAALSIDSDKNGWLDPEFTIEEVPFSGHLAVHVERTKIGYWISTPEVGQFNQPAQLRPLQKWEKRWKLAQTGMYSTCEVQDLLVGEEGWAPPWTMDVDSQRRPWLTPRFTLCTEPRGTATMLVKRTKIGYAVDLMLRPDTYESRDYKWGMVRTNFKGMIPVVSPRQIPESRVKGLVTPRVPPTPLRLTDAELSRPTDAELVTQKVELVREYEPTRYMIKSINSIEVRTPEVIEADALSAASISATTAAQNELQAELDKPTPDPTVFLKDEDRKYLEFFGADLSKIGKPSAELVVRPTSSVRFATSQEVGVQLRKDARKGNRRKALKYNTELLVMVMGIVSMLLVAWFVLVGPPITVTPAHVDTPAQVAELCGNAKESVTHPDLCVVPR